MSARDHIASNFKPKIKMVAEEFINSEASAVKGIGASDDMQDFLDAFYTGFNVEVFNAFRGVLGSYQQSISKATIDELGGRAWLDKFDPTGLLDSFIGTFQFDYARRYAQRHASSSYGQLNALLQEADPVEAIVERVTQWTERRPQKISVNESVRGNNAMFQMIAFYAGFSVRWVTVGANCPYCDSLSGRVISKGQTFLDAGDTLDPGDGEHEPMKIYSKVSHPPAHAFCNCTLSI